MAGLSQKSRFFFPRAFPDVDPITIPVGPSRVIRLTAYHTLELYLSKFAVGRRRSAAGRHGTGRARAFDTLGVSNGRAL